MLASGEDPLYVARRLVRFASEDVGNADPAALRIALDARDAYHFLGMPEGAVPLDGLDTLASYLAESEQVEACMAHCLSYYAYGLDGCSPDAIAAEADANGGTLRGLILAIVRAPHFSTRAAP